MQILPRSTARNPSRGAAGCWLIVLGAVLVVAVVVVLAMRRVDYMRDRQHLTHQCWRELYLQFDRRATLGREAVGLAERAGVAAEAIESFRRASKQAARLGVVPEVPPEELETLAAFLEAQDRVGQSLARVMSGLAEGVKKGQAARVAELEESLGQVQVRIRLASRDFAEFTWSYNAAVRAFPDVILAKLIGLAHLPQPPLASDEESESEGESGE